MDSEFSVAFKAYVNKGGNSTKPEIRYFTIDRGAENNFEYLHAKLINVFPCLLRKTFSISWIDNEQDYVVISSDLELRFALSNMSYDLKKFYITIEDSTDSSDSAGQGASSSRKRASESAPEHFNILCDVCNGSIVGFRYKCVVCPDFDLCQTCESNNNHPEHFMLRIPIPIKSFHCDVSGSQLGEWINMFSKKNCDSEEPTFGKKHCRDRKSFHKEKSHEDKHHHGKHSRHHEKRQFPKFCGKDPEAWVSTFASFMNDFTNLAGDLNFSTEYKKNGPTAASANATASTANATASTANVAASSNNFATSSSSASATPSANTATLSTNATTTPSNTVSSSINVVSPPDNANPLSASNSATQKDENVDPKTSKDVSRGKKLVVRNCVTFDENGSIKLRKTGGLRMSKSTASKMHPRTETEKKFFERMRVNDNPFLRDIEIMRDDENSVAQCGIHPLIIDNEPAERIDGWTVIDDSDDSEDAELVSIPKNTDDQNMEKDMDNIVDGFQTHVQVESGETSAKDPIPLQDTVKLVDPPPTKDVPVTLQAESSSQSYPPITLIPIQIPTAPPPVNDFTPKDPRIAHALNQMMAMGFSNDQGVLTHLLESGDGNINRVLDILTSVRK